MVPLLSTLHQISFDVMLEHGVDISQHLRKAVSVFHENVTNMLLHDQFLNVTMLLHFNFYRLS